MIEENLSEIFNEIKNGNNYGEPITLVAATKTVSIDKINEAIKSGVKDIGDNKVQEFNEKSPFLNNVNFHFIGHLQTNKVKYLIGKVCLIQSVDNLSLAEEISKLSIKKNISTNILVEINAGKEASKSGLFIDDALKEILLISKLKNINVNGLMAMLPKSDDTLFLTELCKKTRNLYDTIKKEIPLTTLSMGMSGDYKIAIENGSNMIRLGSKIFGERNYSEVKIN